MHHKHTHIHIERQFIIAKSCIWIVGENLEKPNKPHTDMGQNMQNSADTARIDLKKLKLWIAAYWATMWLRSADFFKSNYSKTNDPSQTDKCY